MGLDDDLAHSTLRFSLGRFTTEEEIDYVIQQVLINVQQLRKMNSAEIYNNS